MNTKIAPTYIKQVDDMWLNKDSDTAIWKLKFYQYLNHQNLLKFNYCLNNITNYIFNSLQSVVFCFIIITLNLSSLYIIRKTIAIISY